MIGAGRGAIDTLSPGEGQKAKDNKHATTGQVNGRLSRRSSTAERLICNQQVTGSNPVAGSIYDRDQGSGYKLQAPFFVDYSVPDFRSVSYNDLPGVTLVGCCAHAWRHFQEAFSALPEQAQEARVAAKERVAYINRLFGPERVPPEEKYGLALQEHRGPVQWFRC